MASYEVNRARRASWFLLVIFQATKGVFKPGPDDPKTWYGRLLRFLGLLCVYAVIAAGLAIAIQTAIGNFMSSGR
jgi:hypothetical protein